MAAAIQIEGIGKRYALGIARDRYDTLRDSLVGAMRGLGRRSNGSSRDAVWALRDVSFDVEPGEVVGVIGPNGAGKTTLLRILARITDPTEGYGEIHGRVGSLLEVGTGFHPELTGRENVFLNGAILGMRRREIQRRFDEIVDFAGVERFLDTPVKRYSSGMYVRLAFSVAAHLEPEILLVDEVLAVGDAEFQRKCIGKIESVGRSGRTVFFVSHSMPTVASLCERVLLFQKGRLVADGAAEDVVAQYLSADLGSAAEAHWTGDDAPGDDVARMRAVRVVGRDGAVRDSVDLRDEVGIELEFDLLSGESATPMIAVHTSQGAHVFNALDPDARWLDAPSPGRYHSTAWVPANLLNEGLHVVSVFVNTVGPGKMDRHAIAQDAVSFNVVNRRDGVSAKGAYTQQWGGAVSPLLTWQTTTTPAVPGPST